MWHVSLQFFTNFILPTDSRGEEWEEGQDLKTNKNVDRRFNFKKLCTYRDNWQPRRAVFHGREQSQPPEIEGGPATS